MALVVQLNEIFGGLSREYKIRVLKVSGALDRQRGLRGAMCAQAELRVALHGGTHSQRTWLL